ncbi:hypothetical protein ACWD6L_19980 [Micromonospora profundi]
MSVPSGAVGRTVETTFSIEPALIVKAALSVKPALIVKATLSIERTLGLGGLPLAGRRVESGRHLETRGGGADGRHLDG